MRREVRSGVFFALCVVMSAQLVGCVDNMDDGESEQDRLSGGSLASGGLYGNGATSGAGSSSGTESTSGGTTPTDQPTTPYYFVRINDIGTQGGMNPGADIDAVAVVKPNGATAYADQVQEYMPVNAQDLSAMSMLPENILGEPTAFGTPFEPQFAGPDKYCSLDDSHFLGLGGLGAYVIVSFVDAIENGDTVTVYEVGNCDGEGKLDPVQVQVSVSAAVDGNWVTIFEANAGPVMAGMVQNLP
jgi:hypothetical protein